VLALTAVAAVLVAGVFVGWRMWRGDDADDAAPAAAPPSSSVPQTTAVPDDGAEMIRRTTDAGVELRMQLNNFNGGGRVIANGDIGEAVAPTTVAGDDPAGGPDDPNDVDGNGRPDFCDPVGDLAAWAITDDVVLQGSAPWTEGAIPELWPSLMFGGMGEVDFLAVVMQVDADVRSVRLTSPSGAVDEMEPVGGAVVLAVPSREGDGDIGMMGGDPDAFDGYQLVAQNADGTARRADWDVIQQGHPAWGGPGPCNQGMEGEIIVDSEVIDTVPATTMPDLPSAGDEQPADPVAAQAQVEANFDSLYGNPDDDVDRSDIIDDASGLDVVRDQVEDNGFGDEAESATVTIQELVFTSPEEAVFEYTLTTSAANFPGQLGRARLLDGTWKITRGTLCQDLAKAGATCPP